MIPAFITKPHVVEAILRISREGVPPRRNGRGYCLVKDGNHFPPKYIIALAHQIATGQDLRSDKFSGGPESNNFLKTRGFNIVDCNCGGRYRSRSTPSGPSKKRRHITRPTRHSERCHECKIRVREILEHIYGKCLQNHKFSWPTHLCSYEGTSIYSALRNVGTVLEKHRGFGLGDFVRTKTLASCDFWVPDPGFIVEFDESQHFTSPRKLALSAYPGDQPLGFSRERWIELCEQHSAKDDDPPYRDEQRAWYDTLRDFVPLLKGFGPTVRLYASDFAWCSLDANSSDDRQRFVAIALQDAPSAIRATVDTCTSVAPMASSLRVALIFPKVNKGTSHGVPPEGAGVQEPDIPTLASFRGETIDLVLFPEAYIRSSDAKRIKSLMKLSRSLDAPLLVGVIEKDIESTDRAWQVLYRFNSDGSRPHHVYTKHCTAKTVAFERQNWEPNIMLPTLELSAVRVGATICHDHYLGLLPRFLAKRGVRVWVNPSFDNVSEIKWSSILRLRAVENRFFALCTLHDKGRGRSTHPFGFSSEGKELLGRQAGCEIARPLSKCNESGTIYVVDLDMRAVDEPLDWSRLPLAEKPKRARKGKSRKPVRVALRGGEPAIFGRSRWQTIETDCRIETNHGSVYVGVVPKEQILDAAACFRILDYAKQMQCAPIIWNHWDRLPTDSARLATLMMGRAIESCAPILVSDRDGIHELVELSNRIKIPTRRAIELTGEAIVDIGYAWGLTNAFRIVTKWLSPDMKRSALDRYRSLV